MTETPKHEKTQAAGAASDCNDLLGGAVDKREKTVCMECQWRGYSSDLLRAPNPWDESEMLGCPQCYEPNSSLIACDESGCWDLATCGTPAEGGYRRTCSSHMPPNTD